MITFKPQNKSVMIIFNYQNKSVMIKFKVLVSLFLK
jgi:hypothetical protein